MVAAGGHYTNIVDNQLCKEPCASRVRLTDLVHRQTLEIERLNEERWSETDPEQHVSARDNPNTDT